MRTKEARENKKQIVGMIVLLLCIAVCLWSMNTIKVNAQERADNDKLEYQLKERQFVSKVRTSLEAQGYINSGITLTKVMDTHGSRQYKVLVHHADIDMDDTEEVNKVYKILDTIYMEGDALTVSYEIF